MINSNRPIILFVSIWWVNKWYSISLDTIFSYSNLCNSCMGLLIPARIRDILLLLFLVLTSQISMLTFTIRFYARHTIMDDDLEAAPIYRCDSMAEQPVIRPHENHDLCNEMKTYMDGESTEATSTVKSSSYYLDHWIEISKSREHVWAHMVCCKTLGLDQLQHPLLIVRFTPERQ